jgi:GT2 family glycosyltransferase
MKFSVIIPSYQRPKALAACLEAFLHLDYPSGEWELIVVNDGASNSFDAISPNLASQLPLTLLSLSTNQGPAAARNKGASIAKGDYLAFTDDDCLVEKDWLRAFEEGFQATQADALGGDWLNPYPREAGAVTWQLYMSFLREELRDKAGNPLLLLSNNAAYKREVFAALGGFDASFSLAAAEDLDLSHRLVAAFYHQDFCLRAKVWHEHQSSALNFIKQQWRYGRGASYFAEKQYDLDLPKKKRGAFHRHLAKYLWQAKAPFMAWCLLGITPFVHRLGKCYEEGKRKSSVHHQGESA